MYSDADSWSSASLQTASVSIPSLRTVTSSAIEVALVKVGSTSRKNRGRNDQDRVKACRGVHIKPEERWQRIRISVYVDLGALFEVSIV